MHKCAQELQQIVYHIILMKLNCIQLLYSKKKLTFDFRLCSIWRPLTKGRVEVSNKCYMIRVRNKCDTKINRCAQGMRQNYPCKKQTDKKTKQLLR